MAAVTAALVVLAALLLLASGLAALTDRFGFPVAALLGAILVAMLAFAIHLIGRALVARRKARVVEARSRTEADIALAIALTRSARPLLPLVAFLAAFILARRS
jgi:Na+/melibiose symporter-like transporter